MKLVHQQLAQQLSTIIATIIMKLSSVAVLFGAAVAAFFPGASADSVVSFVLFLCFVQVVSDAHLLFGAGMSDALVMMNACCICILHAASCVYPGVCVTLPHLFLTFTFSSSSCPLHHTLSISMWHVLRRHPSRLPLQRLHI